MAKQGANAALERQPTDAIEPDIVENEGDVPLIIDTAREMQGYRTEQSTSIIEVRNAETGALSHRFVDGDPHESAPDHAQYAELWLKSNERLVADVHSHPIIHPADFTLDEVRAARDATQANNYPGVADYAAIVKRHVVTAILRPDGSVIVLRRIHRQASVRVIYGAPLPALSETEAEHLDLGHLYAQGFLAMGQWTASTESSAVAMYSGGENRTVSLTPH